MSYMNTLNSLLSTTTSRYTSLRRQLLSSSSEDDSQVEDPDSSHVSKVLRAYYTEKGRPFPPWLPPDPKARELQQPGQNSFASSASSLRAAGGRNSGGATPQAGSRGSGGGLSDLWADNSAPVKTPQENGSLRRGLAGARLGPRTRTQDTQDLSAPRPLPSQRAGSYQTAVGQQGGGRSASPVPPGSSGSGASVQERLKARLGGRATPTTLGRERSEESGGSYMDGSGDSGGAGGRYSGGGTGGGYGGNPYAATGGQDYDGGGRRAPQRQGGTGLPSGPRQRYT